MSGPDRVHAGAVVAGRIMDNSAERPQMSFTPPATRWSGTRDRTIRIVEKTSTRGCICLSMGRDLFAVDARVFSSDKAQYEFDVENPRESLKYVDSRYNSIK